MKSLIYRHNRITRLTHWINTVALVILFMSGLQIFNAYPNLHWGSKAEPEEAFFSILAENDEGEIRGYVRFYDWQVETTGFLGIQQTEMGPFPRAFPTWLTIPGFFWLAGGRRWHFFFAWVFVLNGVLYLAYNIARGDLCRLLVRPGDLASFPLMVLYYLRLRKASPQEGEYNPLQRLAYTGVVFVLTPVVIASGLAMSPQMDVAFNWLPAMFGGRQSARTFHFLATLLFGLFTFAHVLMVLIKGPVNNMRAMVTGWHAEKIPDPDEETSVPASVETGADPGVRSTEPGPEAGPERAQEKEKREDGEA